MGTIYGCTVATDNGTTFDTAALANAEMFREQCREIRRKATGGAHEHA